jgi:hypothetical protein
MNMTRAATEPFRSLRTARLSFIEGHRQHAAVSPASAAKVSLFNSIKRIAEISSHVQILFLALLALL